MEGVATGEEISHNVESIARTSGISHQKKELLLVQIMMDEIKWQLNHDDNKQT